MLILGPLFTAGCARTLCIKTVDATTGRPLPGVQTRWTADYHDLLLGSYHYGPTNLPPSNESGEIEIQKLKSKYTSRFVFFHAGYGNVYGVNSRGTLTLGTTIQTFSDGVFILNGNLVSAGTSNGCFIVEMKPANH
jgi:hypothetical protein